MKIKNIGRPFQNIWQSVKSLTGKFKFGRKKSTSKWIRSSRNGQKYLVVPLPSRQLAIKIGLGLLAALTLGVIIALAYRYFGPHNYTVSQADNLLSKPSEVLAKSLSFDADKQIYNFTHGTSAGTAEIKQTGATVVSATLPVKASQGITVTDPNYQVEVKMTPQFSLADGKQDGNRIIYPFSGHGGWLVNTATGTGIKEDIVLEKQTSDVRKFSYELKLPSGTEARLETDGSIGVYGNQIFMNSITPATDADASLLEKARQNAEKNLLIFTIPKPTVIESNQKESTVEASFELKGSRLTVIAKNLKNAHYPLSIDPSIYVVTAQQFMNGNNETNVDFDVDNKLIKKAPTTGARFDAWNSTMSMNNTKWRQGTAVAGGYIYTVGGLHPEGGIDTYSTVGSDTFTVPNGITSITVEAWGGGGGGGAAGGTGSSRRGGDGGGGGYTQATFSVTPGETLNVLVGGGGGGGSPRTSTTGAGGGGGGYSGVKRGSTNLVIAAGGGGGGGGGYNTNNVGGAGGAGGGSTGEDGSASGTSSGGGGATQSAGGSAGTGSGAVNDGQAGSSLTGGPGGDGRNGDSASADGGAANGGTNGGGDGGTRNNNYSGAGGGGGGYYGGGGGAGSSYRTGASGGGGGSGYYAAGSGGSTESGSGTTPGNESGDGRAGAGVGGTGGTADTGANGANGIVVIRYGTRETTDTVAWAKFNTANGTLESPNPGNGVCAGWCTTTDYKLPSPRGNFSLVAYNGFLYAIGGEDESCTVANGTGDNGVCNTVYIAKIGANGEPQLWHPTDGNKANWSYWYRDSNLTSPRSAIKAVAYNNRLYLMGGITSSGGTKSVANSTQIADLIPDGRLGGWSASTSLPYSAYGYTSLAYNDRLYLVGGASSVGGPALASVYYNKINADGSLNSWQQTTSMPSGRMSNGGDYGAVWGAYLYVSGGCNTTNSKGYCASIASDSQVASINADGSLDTWNTIGGVSNTRTGHSLVGWRGYIYAVGGCSLQNQITGVCANALSDIIFGKINQDGDASTVGETTDPGSGYCSGANPQDCNMPGTSYIGNMLTNSFINNGYLYLIGGCVNDSCGSTSNDTAYTAISSTGKMTAPASCPSPRILRNSIWCVDTTNTTPSGIAASSPVVFNGRVYLVGGLAGNGNGNDLMRADINQADGSLGSWTNQTLTGLGVNNVSYQYAFARANPADATNNPGNLYIIGGCTASSSAGCTSYSQRVYKCDIRATGPVANCSTSGQLQIGTVPGATGSGIGIMSGTVYANYVYLVGGVTTGLADMSTVRYAKIDDNNNIVAVSGNSWIQSPYEMAVGRRRSAAFGYNGYLYAVGGYEASTGVLADIEFIKINVSDGSLVGGWTVSAVEIHQRWGLTVPVSNSYAYVIGGCINGASPNNCTARTDVIQTFQIYNNDSGTPAGYSNSNSYTSNQQRIGGSATILNGYLFMAGGCTGATDCTNPVTTVSSAPIDANGNIGAWTNQAALLAARGWGKLEAIGGSLYYIGGQNSAGVAQNTVYYATPAGGSVGSWSTASNGLPSARSKFGIANWNNRLYVVGGVDASNTPTNTVLVSPQLNSGGNITSAWSMASTNLPIARSSLASVAYANNLYVFGGVDGSGNYLSDTSYAQINATNGNSGAWTYSTTLPKPLAGAEAKAANGYIYLVGGRDSDTTCAPSTLLAPVSANTTIATGNNPTGVGDWSSTNQRFTGDRYGAAAAYNDGKLYVLGGGCGTTLSYPSASSTVQQTTLLSQPQVAKYSIMMDTDSDVFPNYWLMNGLDNSIGARWQLNYRSMANQQTATKCATMSTWGQTTYFGNVTLGTPGAYIVKDGSGNNISCGRYFFFNVTVDSSQAYGYPDDVSRGPTITDLTLQFTADPSKRLMHGRTFTGGLQQPLDTPTYAN